MKKLINRINKIIENETIKYKIQSELTLFINFKTTS